MPGITGGTSLGAAAGAAAAGLAAAFLALGAAFLAFLAGFFAAFLDFLLDFLAGAFFAFLALDAFFAFFFFFAAMSFTPWFLCSTEKLYASSRECASVSFNFLLRDARVFILITPIRHSSGRLRRHFAVTPSPFLMLRIEGGRELSDAEGRSAEHAR